MSLYRSLLVAVVAIVALLYARPSDAESLKSRVKMANSNPVLTVELDGESLRLILTTDLDGILLCSDLPVGADALVSPKIDFDYARRLLRFQLQGLVVQDYMMRDVSVPALQFEGKMALGSFAIKKQWLSPAAIQYFLTGSQANGFIGVGFAFRSTHSHFWSMFRSDSGGGLRNSASHQQYSYRGFDATSKVAALALRSTNATDDEDDSREKNEEEEEGDLVNGFVSSSNSGDGKRALVWSEPLAPIVSDDDDTNSQGISFPIHRAFFRCAPTLASEDESSAVSPQTARDVNVFGEFSGNWDVVVDFNAPCLALPQQFFDSLAGWLGLRHNDELKLAEISSAMPLPDLVFAMSLDGPQLSIPLQRLVLAELEVATTPANASSATAASSKQNGWTRLCIQRSGSIIQNGAAMFSPLDPDVGAAQRYRIHGSLSLPLFNMFQAPVVFGAMVLNAFAEVAVDGATKQTGIRGLLPDESTSEHDASAAYATCLRPVQCVGQQQFVPRLNACQDPDCSLYYFQSLDAATKRCVVDAGWTSVLGITLTVFLAAETLVSLSIRRLVSASRTQDSPPFASSQ